jgi:RNA polymerase sigma-70 factor (ECF subfamily)
VVYKNERIPNNSLPTDKVLVENVISGNTNAFGQIIKNTEGLVAQIIFKMINNIEDRQDIAQDVYLKAFRNLSGFKFQSKLSTWIGQITYNSCVNFLEKKKLLLVDNKFGESESDYEALEKLSIDKELNKGLEQLIYQKQAANILKIEIENLPPVYKTLITLFHNEELSYAEISEITQLPEGTIKNYLFRARKVLKNNLLANYKKEDL